MARNRLGLTRFQHASVRLYVAGYSQKEIALRLNLSEGTIGCHIDKARSNLGVGTRFELFREILKRAGVPDVPALVDKAAGVLMRARDWISSFLYLAAIFSLAYAAGYWTPLP